MKTDIDENAAAESADGEIVSAPGEDERSEEYRKARAIGEELLNAFTLASKEAREELQRLGIIDQGEHLELRESKGSPRVP